MYKNHEYAIANSYTLIMKRETVKHHLCEIYSLFTFPLLLRGLLISGAPPARRQV